MGGLKQATAGPGPFASPRLYPFVLLVAQLVLAWVFIRAGLPKIQDPLAFAVSIEAYRVISGGLVNWVALFLPWLELVLALGLLTPWCKQASAGIMASLLAVFIALHTSAWVRGLDVQCGCFGLSETSPAYHWLILRNAALLGLALWVLWSARSRKES